MIQVSKKKKKSKKNIQSLSLYDSFISEDASNIRQRYEDILDIMKNQDNTHIGNIKDKSILPHFHGVQKKSAFILVMK